MHARWLLLVVLLGCVVVAFATGAEARESAMSAPLLRGVSGADGKYGRPEWFPLRRGADGAQVRVGCTYHSSAGSSYNCAGYHPWWALDLLVAKGAPVYAAGAGFATRHLGGGYGYYVTVDHGTYGRTLYGHLSSYEIPADGAWVDETDVIGLSGNSGTKAYHLHFERVANRGVWGSRGTAVDPGELKACHRSTLTTYPAAWGLKSWEGIAWGFYNAYGDGTDCLASPRDFRVTVVSQRRIVTRWRSPQNAARLDHYAVFSNDSRVTGVEGTSYAFADLKCGTHYTLSVHSVDRAGHRLGSANLTRTTSACAPGGTAGTTTTPATTSPPKAAPDTVVPSMPPGMEVTIRRIDALSVGWRNANDNVGVDHYDVYLNNERAGSTAADKTGYTFAELRCGMRYALAVVAVDAAGNRSPQAAIAANTSACLDPSPPTMPPGLEVTIRRTDGLTVGWRDSTDNVGVDHYDVYLNAARVATTTADKTGYTYAGLKCGTRYELSVAAFDATGNRSPQATINANTSAC
jgi:chitodextrinase